MLKGCQNSLAMQEYTQETADQMLQIKTAHQSQLRAAFKRRIKMPYTPFVTSVPRVQPGKERATKALAPERCCPPPRLFKGARGALWEGFESSEMETTCKHTPLGRAPCARQRADHQLTTCVKCSQSVWLVWESNRTGGQKGSHPLERAWHVTCVFAAREESHSKDCVGEAAWQDKVVSPCFLYCSLSHLIVR